MLGAEDLHPETLCGGALWPSAQWRARTQPEPEPEASTSALPAIERSIQRARAWLAARLTLAGYLLAAVAVTWRLWADPASRTVAGNPGDADLFAWYMRYAAAAVAHGHMPALVTPALNAPDGVNLMWNSSLLLPRQELALTTVVTGILLVACLATGYPRQALRRARPAAAGLAVAGCTTLALAGWGLWVQFFGPLAQSGSPFTRDFYENDLIGTG